MEHALTSLFYLLKDSLARREDYSKLTGSMVFGENAPVAERLLSIRPHMKEYVSAVQSRKLPYPKNKSFKCVAKCCDDLLFLVRVNV